MNKNLAMIIGAGAALVLGAHLAFSAENVDQAISLSGGTAVAFAKAPTPSASSEPIHIVFEKKNTVSLRTPFTDSFVDDLKGQLLAIDQTLGKGERIKLYLNTPGGSIGAGESLIDTIAGLNHPVDIVVQFAASMGFMTTESNRGNRYVLGSGTLMAHRAYMGIEGQVPGQFDERARFNEEDIKALETIAATRIGRTHDDYANLVKNEYWVTGERAVAAKTADAVVTATCSKDLEGTYTQTLQTMFGPVLIEWANCPLIDSPVDVRLGGEELYLKDPLQVSQANLLLQNIRTVLSDPRSMIDNVTLENSFFPHVK